VQPGWFGHDPWKEFKPADFFAELVGRPCLEHSAIKDYVEELRLSKQNKESLAVLASYQAKFPI